jgi:uncharacterized protein YjiS (DUF1127 family)
MSDDGFDLFAGDARHLTPQQWTALRKCIIGRAHEERNRAIRQTVTSASRAIRSAWRRIRCRREARATLRSMTDLELWDMGLSRSGIEAAIRRGDKEATGDISRREIGTAMRSNARYASGP